jgi:hypothetical protein
MVTAVSKSCPTCVGHLKVGGDALIHPWCFCKKHIFIYLNFKNLPIAPKTNLYLAAVHCQRFMVLTRRQQKEQAATLIQRHYRCYTYRRLRSWAANWDDVDPISLEQIRSLPQVRLFRMQVGRKTYAFDSWAWLRWIYRSEVHPTNREAITPEAIWDCYRAARDSADVLADVPADVKRTLQKFQNPVNIRNVSIVSVRPVRWYMLVYVSPLYKLLYLNVQICGTAPPFAKVSYDVNERTLTSESVTSDMGATDVSRVAEDRGFIFASDSLATLQAEEDVNSVMESSTTGNMDDSEYEP